MSTLNLRRLAVLVVCLAVGLVFWDSPVLWPLKVLVVMIHETGHAVASLLVGGSVDSISVSGNEGGHCLSRLPDSASVNRNDCSGPEGSRRGTSNASAGVNRRSNA